MTFVVNEIPQNTARQAKQCPCGPEMMGLQFKKKRKTRVERRLQSEEIPNIVVQSSSH